MTSNLTDADFNADRPESGGYLPGNAYWPVEFVNEHAWAPFLERTGPPPRAPDRCALLSIVVILDDEDAGAAQIETPFSRNAERGCDGGPLGGNAAVGTMWEFWSGSRRDRGLRHGLPVGLS